MDIKPSLIDVFNLNIKKFNNAIALNIVNSICTTNFGVSSESFDLEFGLSNVTVPDKYCSGYIPLCLKLSKWCKDKGVLDVTEDLLFSITSLYLNSANLNGLTVTELELTNDFEVEIEYALW